jgi:hypothetical protein
VLDAAADCELDPPPPDPYERITAIVQSPVIVPKAESRRALSLPSGIIPLDAAAM